MNEEIEQILNDWANSRDLHGNKTFTQISSICEGERLYKIEIAIKISFGNSNESKQISKIKYFGTFFDQSNDQNKYQIDNQQLRKTLDVLEREFINEVSNSYSEVINQM